MRPSITVRLITIAAFLALLAVGCGQPKTGISIQDPFARPSPGTGNGGAFMVITNNSNQTDRLVSAQSPAAMMVELHETINDGGVMKMVPQPQGFEIPAGAQVALEPGGKHVMLMGLKETLAVGQNIEITLKFERAGEITIKVPVQEMK